MNTSLTHAKRQCKTAHVEVLKTVQWKAVTVAQHGWRLGASTKVSWCTVGENKTRAWAERGKTEGKKERKDKTERDKYVREQRERMEETTGECGMVGKHCIISFVGLQVWSVVWSAGHRQDIYTLRLAHKSCHMAERTDTASILAPAKPCSV